MRRTFIVSTDGRACLLTRDTLKTTTVHLTSARPSALKKEERKKILDKQYSGSACGSCYFELALPIFTHWQATGKTVGDVENAPGGLCDCTVSQVPSRHACTYKCLCEAPGVTLTLIVKNSETELAHMPVWLGRGMLE